jgi:predicted aspartyl protease
MVRVRILTPLVLVPLAFALPHAAAGEIAPASTLEEDAPLYASSTRLDRIGRVVAPVTINGSGPFRLVVDTGASHSTFSPRLADALGLTPSLESPLLLNGVTGVAPVPTVLVKRIQAGEVLIEDVKVPVVWSTIMADADGILGVAGLRREKIFVDFRNDRIVITRSSDRLDTSGFVTIPARRVAGGLLQVLATINGVPARVVVDTGAERTLGNLALRRSLQRAAVKRKRDIKWAATRVFGATEDVAHGESSIATDIRIGEALISGADIVYGDFHIFKVWEMDRKPAVLLGMDVLGTVGAMVIDYGAREIHLDLRKIAPSARQDP